MANDEKLIEYLQDMIAYLSRMEAREYEPEEQAKNRHSRYILEAMLKQVEDGVFE